MSLINKKIKNATPTTVDGIAFKSRLEANAYKALLEAGFLVEYEPLKLTLVTGYKPDKENYYAPEKKGKGKMIMHLEKIRDITYTPDFVVNKKYLIELKGKQNDCYPLKQKLFRQVLDTSQFIFFEVHNLTQLKETIEIINRYESL